MSQSIKQKLVALGADALADLLIEVARDSESAQNKVQRAVSSKTQNVSLFQQKLKSIINDSRRFIPWKYSASFADELRDLLQDIKEGASDPNQGLSLVVEFFKADEHFFNMVDDSSGHVGGIFRFEALELFAEYAKGIEDRHKLIEIVVELLEKDDYGVMDCLIDEAHKFLDKNDLERLFEIVQKRSSGTRQDQRDSWDWKLPEIARQVGNAQLFEELTRKQAGDRINGKLIVDIASVYFESGDLSKAQALIDEISNEDSFAFFDKKELQKKILKASGRTQELTSLLIDQFNQHYSKHTLNELLEVVGVEARQKYCLASIEKIVKRTTWNSSDAEFLVYCEAFDETEQYIFKHQGSLDGDYYSSLLSIAVAMEENNKPLAASLIYRALLDSILARAISKYYHHGVNYLEKLEVLSRKVIDWSNFASHQTYFEGLKKTHARKSSFWSRFNN